MLQVLFFSVVGQSANVLKIKSNSGSVPVHAVQAYPCVLSEDQIKLEGG